MLILLPPSEGKHAPTRGKGLDLASLSSPTLTAARAQLLDALIDLCGGPDLVDADEARIDRAAEVLGVGRTQRDLVRANGHLWSAPTTRADRLYTGVLYDALDVASLSAAAKRRAAARIGIISSVFGMVRPTDHLPSYRLSGDVTLPGLGSVAGFWREHLGPAVTDALGDGLLVDLRSTTYAAFWRPPADLADRVVTLRVLHEHEGRRTVVSHFNKATKGRIVRDLLEDGSRPRRPADLADLLGDLGWEVEPQPSGRRGTGFDVVVTGL